MPQALKQIKNRIRSVESSKKVTSALEMISAVKLNSTQKTLIALRPYTRKMQTMLSNLLQTAEGISHPLLDPRKSVRKIALYVFTSDNGLCGVYNNNVIRAAENFIRDHDPAKIKLFIVGKRGFYYFKNRPWEIAQTYFGINGRFSKSFCDKLTDELTERYLSREVDEVYVAYTFCKTAAVQVPLVEKILNLTPGEGKPVDYLWEPDIVSVLSGLIPQYITMKMRLMLVESLTSEHAARTIAMKSATDNAKELLEGLVLLRNKVRQATITQEIMEVVSSAEALKG